MSFEEQRQIYDEAFDRGWNNGREELRNALAEEIAEIKNEPMQELSKRIRNQTIDRILDIVEVKADE